MNTTIDSTEIKLTPSERVHALVSGTTPEAIPDTPKRRLNADLQNTSLFFAASVALGMAFVMTHGILDHSASDAVVHQSTVGLWAIACLACGTAGGFLFAIPKVHQSDSAASAERGAAPSDANYRQQVNTNLEDISDWITKIIVGLGLINIGRFPGFFDRLSQRLAVSSSMDQKAFALSLIVYFLVIGFLFGYLITRMFLQRALGDADQAASGTVQAATLDTLNKAAAAKDAAERAVTASQSGSMTRRPKARRKKPLSPHNLGTQTG